MLSISCAMRRRRIKHHRRHAGHSGIIAAILIMLVAACTAVYSQIAPVIGDLSKFAANNAVYAAINDVISDKLAAGELKYDDIIKLDKDNNGEVSAIRTDMAKVNQLKSEITVDVIKALSGEMSTELHIPVGDITGLNLFAGKGPGIPVKIASITNAKTDFANKFTDSGVNQTRHQIFIVISADVKIIMPGKTLETKVNEKFAVAETIIVGDVPDSYTYFESDDAYDEPVEKFDILS